VVVARVSISTLFTFSGQRATGKVFRDWSWLSIMADVVSGQGGSGAGLEGLAGAARAAVGDQPRALPPGAGRAAFLALIKALPPDR
jgi:hypothetical protein